MISDKILLGTAQLGLNYGINNKNGKPSLESAINILDAAFKNNIHFLDTAEAYGNAQEIIGNFHQHQNKKFNVVTKLSESSLQKFGDLTKIIEADKQELQLDCLYGYLFHSIELYKKHFDKELFKRLKEERQILNIGVSVYTNDEALEVSNDVNIDIVQLPFNVLDNMNLRGDVLQTLKEQGKEVHVRSVFLQGVLLMNEKELPDKFKVLEKYLKVILEIAKRRNLSMRELALSYVLQNDLIDKVLIGVDSLNQLSQHISFLNNFTALPKAEVDRINSISVVERELLNPVNW